MTILLVKELTDDPKLLKVIERQKDEFKKYYELDEVNSIRCWLDKQQHLPEITDDEIIVFLNSRQFRLERTKLAIDEYFTMRSLTPEIFSHRDIKYYQNLLPVYYAPSPLECKTLNGNHILSLGLSTADPTNYNFILLIKYAMAMYDFIAAKNPLTTGYELLFDAKNFTFIHLAKVNLGYLKKTLLYLQRGLPIRLKAFHILNASPASQSCIELIRPFLKSHLMKKIHVYSSSELNILMEKCVPKSILSSDYGGEGESLQKLYDDLCNELLAAQRWLNNMDKTQQVNEKKRLGKAVTSSDIFGMEGSFRQLAFD